MSFFMRVLSRAAGSPCRTLRRGVNRSRGSMVPNPSGLGKSPWCATPRTVPVFPTGAARWEGSVGAGEERLHPRGELAGTERLGDVVVRAGVEAGLDVGLLGPGRQQDD